MNAQFFVYILASGRSGTLYVGVTKPLGGVTEAEFTKLIDAEAQATRKAGDVPRPPSTATSLLPPLRTYCGVAPSLRHGDTSKQLPRYDDHGHVQKFGDPAGWKDQSQGDVWR